MKRKTTSYFRVYFTAVMVVCLAIGAGFPLAAQKAHGKDVHKGEVLETMDSGGYTYVKFREQGKEKWAAARLFQVKKGDTIEFSKAAPMTNFHSPKLKKTFESIFFVGTVKVNGKVPGSGNSPHNANLPAGHAPIGNKSASKAKKPVVVKPGTIQKVEGGYTVAQLYAGKDSLNGKQIKVRGRVVKFNSNIMGKNWLHIKDGSGNTGTNDLTVTTQQNASVGDLNRGYRNCYLR